MDQLISEATDYVKEICQQHKIDETHALNHALNVMKHVKQSIINDTRFHLDAQTQIDLLLTSLLHDLDDHKYYSNDSHNAQTFLETRLCEDRVQRILSWIGYISTSKNGNHIPNDAILAPWILWPRYCDRIEAVGKVGIARVIEYSHQHNVVDYVATTPKATTYEDVMIYATPERFEQYLSNNGTSVSLIDHIYDKLLHICDVETYSPYINHHLSVGKHALIDMCLRYGKYGYV